MASEKTDRHQWLRTEEIEVATMRWCGMKVTTISRLVGISATAVRRRLSRLGVVVESFKTPRRGRGKLLAAVRELSRRGYPVGEQAERLGVDPSAVSRCRKRLGYGATPHHDRALRGWEWRKRHADR